MIKSVKRLGAAVLSAVMMLTAVATPLGDNLPAVRESTSLTAGAMSTSEVKNKIEAMARGDYGAEFKAGNYWNTKITSPCTRGTNYQHANQNYDKKYPLYLVDTNGKSIHSDSGAIQCKGFGYAVFDQLFGGGDKNAIVATKTTYTGTNKKQYIIDNAVVGDLLVLIESGSTYGHTGIYYGYDNNYLKMYDANGYSNGGTCKISITENRPWTDKKFYNNSTVIIMHAKCNGSTGGNIDNPATNVTDHYKLTSPDGYQTIRKEASTNSANLGSINAGNIVCVTKYSSDNKWGYLTYNGVSGWIRLYYVEKTGSSHSYGSWYTKTSATCTSGGTEERKCSCGATESRSTSALGHNYGSWSTVTNATCTSGGSEKRTCSRCSNSETRSTSALGHNFGSTYFEADHPHKYAHLCQRCGYKEFTGGNLAIYEKCDICYNENLPSKPCLNISSNGFKESDNVSFTWNDTEKTTHYVLTIAVLSGDEYKTVCRETYVNSGFQTTFGKGQYRALLQSYNSNMFHQYTSDWRDWVHNNSDYVYFDIECAHEYLKNVVKPTFESEGYTQYTCTKCGDSYISDYTAKLTLSKVTNFKVKSLTSTKVTLQWNKNANASGYEIEQYKSGKWVNVAKITGNATTSYTVKGLAAGTAGYKFRMRAVKDGAYSDYTSVLTVNTNPYGVGGFKCSSKTSTSVTLKWNKGTTASGYQLQQYKDGKWVTIYTGTKATNTSYTVKGLKAGTAGYRFRIRAYKTYGNTKQYGSWSSEVKVNTNPYGVGGFKCSSKSSTSVTLKWNKGTTASGYQLQQYKNGKWVTIYTGTKATDTSYTVKNLKAGTAGYRFRIRAYKTYGNTKQYGSWSSEVKVNTNPYGVSGFKCSSKTSTSVTLKWNKGTTASGYQLQQYKGGKWVTVYTGTKAASTSYTVKSLKSNTSYKFRIRAYKTYGNTKQYGSWSSTLTVKTKR